MRSSAPHVDLPCDSLRDISLTLRLCTVARWLEDASKYLTLKVKESQESIEAIKQEINELDIIHEQTMAEQGGLIKEQTRALAEHDNNIERTEQWSKCAASPCHLHPDIRNLQVIPQY